MQSQSEGVTASSLGEKFKVIFLQTTIAQKKTTCDFERRFATRADSKKDSPCDSESKGGDEPLVRDILRGQARQVNPSSSPPRKKPAIPREHSAASDISRCVAEQRINEQGQWPRVRGRGAQRKLSAKKTYSTQRVTSARVSCWILASASVESWTRMMASRSAALTDLDAAHLTVTWAPTMTTTPRQVGQT